MRKAFIHVGFAKCGSTSLQEALSNVSSILYPNAGSASNEHLAFPLHYRGVDEWTRQFYSQEWADREHALMLEEISSSDKIVVISSERLAAMSPSEALRMKHDMDGFDVEIIVVRRSLSAYLSSTWRHAVFHHDLAESYDDFLERTKNFNFFSVSRTFEELFKVHYFDMDDPSYPKEISNLIGEDIYFPKSNVGVPFDFAETLQKMHALLGSEVFKNVFTHPMKRKMLAVYLGEDSVAIDPILADLL